MPDSIQAGNESVALNKVAADAEKTLKLTIDQYQSGIVPSSSVITAEIAAYTAEQNASNAIGLRMTATVGLIMALGGGWSATH